ncbi:MAG: glycine zipper family protein [Rhodobacteraceae bacterium]|nr:glycine zipper family protein [Paracoccaceae bacterium]
MTFRPSLHAVSLFLMLGACADSGANYTPIVDGSKSPVFASDLGACQRLAANQRQYDDETRAAAVLGAGVGALAGLADGGNADDAIGGAIAGALIGGVAVGVEAQEKKQNIVIACMRGRGHKVVG